MVCACSFVHRFGSGCSTRVIEALTLQRLQGNATKGVFMKPADYVLIAAAFFSFLFSVYLWFQGMREEGLFVGIWVPSILSFGGFVRAALKR